MSYNSNKDKYFGRGPRYESAGARGGSRFNSRPFRKQQLRFGVNTRRGAGLVMDEHIQEATPEHLRIEIDKIISNFLADPEATEYIFPADYNNLQRKYIHCMAQQLNLVSRSHGRGDDRQLHLHKRSKEVSTEGFALTVGPEVLTRLQQYFEKANIDSHLTKLQPKRCVDKVFSRLEDSLPVVPSVRKVADSMLHFQQQLIIYGKKHDVMQEIHNNQVVIISSETGSGKTTQIPQFIMEEGSIRNHVVKIICTQPRRISTIAAAERVAHERGETVGHSVGYQIRLDSKFGSNSSLIYCTVGVLVRNFMCGSSWLKNVTHIIVDEIHERDSLTDFLLICLRQNLRSYRHLKVILMSATIDTTKFQKYFDTKSVLSLPGRQHSIETYFLEDVLSLTQYYSAQMKRADDKHKPYDYREPGVSNPVPNQKLSDQDQANFDAALDAYQSLKRDSTNEDFEEAVANLEQLFESEDVHIDTRHSVEGHTALMVACSLGDMEFITKLYKYGASLDVADGFGRTAFDYAASVNPEVVDLLNVIKAKIESNNGAANLEDPQRMLKLYDMVTPDEFIDYELIVELIKYIYKHSRNGSILIFLPGYDEIMQCNDHILECDEISMAYRIFFLHSSMNMKDQCDVFIPLPEMRKLILSTNIAETSITVEDVVFVIDSGKVKEKAYDSYMKMSSLQTQWISRACAKQRQGRAGRVSNGYCFRIYSKQRYDSMAEDRVPEILRVSLEELCLHTKIIAPKNMNVYDFLRLAPDPPAPNSVEVAIHHLQSLGALDKEEGLTRLGEYLAQLTVEPRLGKMLILSTIFKCIEPMLTLCASLGERDPFQLPTQANLRSHAASKRRDLLGGIPSDTIIYVLLFQKWQEEFRKHRSREFCRDYFISEPTMNVILDTRRKLLSQLRAIGFVYSDQMSEFSVNSKCWGLVKAIMCASYFPNIAYPTDNGRFLATRNQKNLHIHKSSVCFDRSYNWWCFYDELVKNRLNLMVKGVTFCSPLMIALLCGNDVNYSSSSLIIDDWLEFDCPDSVIRFRRVLQAYIDSCISNPLHSSNRQNMNITKVFRDIMEITEMESGLPQPHDIGAKPMFFQRHNDFVPNIPSKNGKYGFKKSTDQQKDSSTPRRFFPPGTRNRQEEHSSRWDACHPSTSDMPFGQLSVRSDERQFNRDTGSSGSNIFVPAFVSNSSNASGQVRLNGDYDSASAVVPNEIYYQGDHNLPHPQTQGRNYARYNYYNFQSQPSTSDMATSQLAAGFRGMQISTENSSNQSHLNGYQNSACALPLTGANNGDSFNFSNCHRPFHNNGHKSYGKRRFRR